MSAELGFFLLAWLILAGSAWVLRSARKALAGASERLTEAKCFREVHQIFVDGVKVSEKIEERPA